MNNDKLIIARLLIINLLLSCNYIHSTTPKSNYQQDNANFIFIKFEEGIISGAVKEFSQYLSLETYISLENGISSYFSANQSFYVLKDYLNQYRPINFKLGRIRTNVDLPFAVGTFTYILNGVKGTSQVFVSLNKEDSEWKIAQITIN